MPLVKVKYVGPADGSDGEASTGLTHNKVYTLLSITDTKAGILLNDLSKFYLTQNDLNTSGVWQFVSATYQDCSTINV